MRTKVLSLKDLASCIRNAESEIVTALKNISRHIFLAEQTYVYNINCKSIYIFLFWACWYLMLELTLKWYSYVGMLC